MLTFPAIRMPDDEREAPGATFRDDPRVGVALPLEPVRRRRSPRAGVTSMVIGAAAVLLCAGALTLSPPEVEVHDLGPVAATENVPAGPLALTLSGPGDVTVLRQAYEPGKTSGWHAHAGMHAVAVLSGTLTIYDERCEAHTIRSGESYVGGQENHLVRNESDVPVEMVVTFLNPGGPHDSTRQLARPTGCAAGVAT